MWGHPLVAGLGTLNQVGAPVLSDANGMLLSLDRPGLIDGQASTSSSHWPLENDQRLLSLRLCLWYQCRRVDGKTILRYGIELVLEVWKTAGVSDTSDKPIFASGPAALR